MKSLVIASVLLLSLASCQKKQCWTCHWHEVDATIHEDTVKILPVCDKTKKEIHSYEDDVNGQNYVGLNLQPVYVHMTCD